MVKFVAGQHIQPRRWKRIFIPLTALAVIVVMVALVVHNLNAPAVGSIAQAPPSQAQKTDRYANPGTYSGKYVSFTYPAHYKKIPSQLTNPFLEVVKYYATDQSGKQITVGIIKETLSEDSGVTLRQSQPQTYQQQPKTRTGALIFTSASNGNEQTAFLQHADKVISISVTSPPGWNLEPDLETVLNSLQWK